MFRAWAGAAAGLLLALGFPAGSSAIVVEVSEIISVSRGIDYFNTGSPYGDLSCDLAGSCVDALTRDGSLDLGSRYGCTEPPENGDSACWVRYAISESSADASTIAAIKIALHPDSASHLQVYVEDTQGEGYSLHLDGVPGSSAFQDVPDVEGIEARFLSIGGVEVGEYLGILEVEIYVEVDEVQPLGASASTRMSIPATSTTGTGPAMGTVDGDISDTDSWTCPSGEDSCEIMYDMGAVESLEQLRITFADSTDSEGTFNILAAGESGVFAPVRQGLQAGGRPVGSDGFQTFGGVRALARYVKIEAVPAVSGGDIVINEVEFRVGEEAPARPVAERPWLKPTGMLPLGTTLGNADAPLHDLRAPSAGGCDSPGLFDGCHVFYMKDGDMSDDSRWTCGPSASEDAYLSTGGGDCQVQFHLNQHRYVRQIQLAFHLGDQQHDEFAIQAYVKDSGWATIVPSVITSGDTSDYQTFNVAVHTGLIRLVPKFQRYYQWIGIKEMVILEKRKNSFVEGTVPVLAEVMWWARDEITKFSKRFGFDIPQSGDSSYFEVPFSTVSAIRIRFPADRTFVFNVLSTRFSDAISQTFTSAGGEERVWETFSFTEAFDTSGIYIEAVEGPTFEGKYYPALRVVDFQIVGEIIRDPGHFRMVSTAIAEWGVVPDIIGDGGSEQQEIMTAICETKGAAFDGTDCVGELDDSPVSIDLIRGNFYFDGPIFLKSGVSLSGGFSDDSPQWTYAIVYDGPNTGSTNEEALIVMDGVVGAEVEDIYFTNTLDESSPVMPGTLGNLCVEVRNSQEISLHFLNFWKARSGAARFYDSSDIDINVVFSGEEFLAEGNYMELTRVDRFFFRVFPGMAGVLIDTCTDVVFESFDSGGEYYDPVFEAPPPTATGTQGANVLITGHTSGVVFRGFEVGAGTEPRILVESTEPLTLDNAEYTDAVSGDCIVQVPEGTTEDFIVQVNSEDANLTKSGDCWVL